MNTRILFIACVGLFLMACQFISNQFLAPPTPTRLPATVTPIPTSTPKPNLYKPGFWRGSGSWGGFDMKIYFRVVDDENIADFTAEISQKVLGEICTIKIEQATINPDGIFALKTGVSAKTGNDSELLGFFKTSTQVLGTGSQAMVCDGWNTDWIGDPPYSSWVANPIE